MPQSGLFPRGFARNTGSHAERSVHDALKMQLPAGWFAWHSLRIRSADGAEGEGDFVIVDPDAGFMVMEIKGGQIEERDGHWFQNAAPMKEAPREQGHRFARKLVERLRANGCVSPGFGIVTFFPDTGFDRPPPNDDLNRVILGKQDLPWLREALRSAMNRALTHQCKAKGPWIETLHQFWGETWTPHLRLGQRSRLEAADRIQLDDDQLSVLDSLAENDSLLVEGGAGTGKTLLACEAALRLARDGKKVLLLCFTDALAKWLSIKACHENLKVAAIRRFAAEALGDAGIAVGDKNAPDFWKDISWRAAAEALPQVARRTDAVIIDEGQDFAMEDWLLVEELSRNCRLWGFWDPSQAFWPERPIRADLFKARFKLRQTYRCPEAVRVLADAYLGKVPDDRILREAASTGIIKIISCPTRVRSEESLRLNWTNCFQKVSRHPTSRSCRCAATPHRNPSFTWTNWERIRLFAPTMTRLIPA